MEGQVTKAPGIYFYRKKINLSEPIGTCSVLKESLRKSRPSHKYELQNPFAQDQQVLGMFGQALRENYHR